MSSTPPADALLNALAYSDARRRPDRAKRIRWVSPHAVEGAIIGRTELLKLLNEAHACFVDGHDIATLIVAVAAIEQVLAEELTGAGLAGHGTPLSQFTDIARKCNLFTAGLLDEVDRLRKLRNPYAHLKPDDHLHSLGNRYMAQGRHPSLLVEEDAKAALETMYAMFRYSLKPPDL